MSKKDYQAIARAIHASGLIRYPGTFCTVVEELARVCAADNPRFNRARFVEACETGRTKGMKPAPEVDCHGLPCGRLSGVAQARALDSGVPRA